MDNSLMKKAYEIRKDKKYFSISQIEKNIDKQIYTPFTKKAVIVEIKRQRELMEVSYVSNK